MSYLLKKPYLVKVLILSILALVIAVPTYAQDFSNLDDKNDVVHLLPDETVNKDYSAAGGTVTIDGTINGDAYLFGGNVEVNGKIDGDLIAAGGNIVVKGEVTQNIRAAGGNITINGKVGRNVSIASGNVRLEGNDPVMGNVWLASGQATITKPVQKDLNSSGGNLYLNSLVGGSVNGRAGELTLGRNLKVNGDLTYNAPASAQLHPEATVSGKINYTPSPKEVDTQRFIGTLTRGAFYFSLYNSVVLFLISWLLWHLFPIFSRNVVTNISSKPLKSTLVGLLTFVSTPVLFVLLLITIIGIPLAFLLVLALFILTYIGYGYIASWIGQRLLANFGYNDSVPSSIITGVIFLLVASLIPIVSVIVSILAALVGTGALLATKFEYYPKLRKDKLI